jgi:hypothetical protein
LFISQVIRISLTLPEFLHAEAARRFQLGEADCLTLVADWVLLRTGADPIAHCRGYRAKAEADALLAGWGGLPRVMGRAARRAGLALTRNPLPGDIAAVALGSVALGAIRTSRGWIMRLDDGLASVPRERVRVLAAWSV